MRERAEERGRERLGSALKAGRLVTASGGEWRGSACALRFSTRCAHNYQTSGQRVAGEVGESERRPNTNIRVEPEFLPALTARVFRRVGSVALQILHEAPDIGRGDIE